MKKILYLLLLFVPLTQSCSKTCPKFDITLLRWFPLSINDKIYFQNQHGDTLIFTVFNKNVTDEYKESKCAKCDCEATASIESKGDKGYDLQALGVEFLTYKNEINISIGLRIEESNGSLNISTNEFSNIVLNNVIIDSVLYNEVLTFEKDTVTYSDEEIWKVIVAKDYGVIKFYDKATGFEWSLLKK